MKLIKTYKLILPIVFYCLLLGLSISLLITNISYILEIAKYLSDIGSNPNEAITSISLIYPRMFKLVVEVIPIVIALTGILYTSIKSSRSIKAKRFKNSSDILIKLSYLVAIIIPFLGNIIFNSFASNISGNNNNNYGFGLYHIIGILTIILGITYVILSTMLYKLKTKYNTKNLITNLVSIFIVLSIGISNFIYYLIGDYTNIVLAIFILILTLVIISRHILLIFIKEEFYIEHVKTMNQVLPKVNNDTSDDKKLSKYDELIKLKELLDKDVITIEEFNKIKSDKLKDL